MTTRPVGELQHAVTRSLHVRAGKHIRRRIGQTTRNARAACSQRGHELDVDRHPHGCPDAPEEVSRTLLRDVTNGGLREVLAVSANRSFEFRKDLSAVE